MTQEEAIAELCDTIDRQLNRLNAQLQELLDLFKEGITVYPEKVDKE